MDSRSDSVRFALRVGVRLLTPWIHKSSPLLLSVAAAISHYLDCWELTPDDYGSEIFIRRTKFTTEFWCVTISLRHLCVALCYTGISPILEHKGDDFRPLASAVLTDCSDDPDLENSTVLQVLPSLGCTVARAEAVVELVYKGPAVSEGATLPCPLDQYRLHKCGTYSPLLLFSFKKTWNLPSAALENRKRVATTT